MISIKKISIALGLCLATLATASNNSFVTAITDVEAINNIVPSDADNMRDFLAATSDVLADKRDYQPESRHQRYVGLGFALSMSNGNPHSGECNGNGHLGNANGNGSGHKKCGDPSPSD